jgi:hypothetical protein
MPGFDDILKKGKQAGTITAPKDTISSLVGSILQSLYRLNDIYEGKPTEHFVESIKIENCSKCRAIIYLLIVVDIDDKTKSTVWRLDTCKLDAYGGYLCDKCSKI